MKRDYKFMLLGDRQSSVFGNTATVFLVNNNSYYLIEDKFELKAEAITQARYLSVKDSEVVFFSYNIETEEVEKILIDQA